MRVVIQRVSQASVSVDNNRKSQIKKGLLILLGVEVKDDYDDVLWLVNKIPSLRIFSDSNGMMNNSIIDVKGDIVVVSQFTLHAKTKKGNRPSYMKAAKPMSNAKAEADTTKVSVRLSNLSMASPLVLISLTAGLPSILSRISS